MLDFSIFSTFGYALIVGSTSLFVLAIGAFIWLALKR